MGRDVIEQAIRNLSQKLYQVENQVSDINDSLHTLLNDLDNPTKVLADGLSSPPKRCRGRCTGKSPEEQHILRNLAATGVARVDYTPLPDGRAKVTIDGGNEMLLAPVLADLMRTLCEDSGDSSDGLVGFKRPAELVRSLGKKANKEVTRPALREAVRRLRNALTASKYNRYLLQNDRRWGYRFALRRSGEDVIVPTPM